MKSFLLTCLILLNLVAASVNVITPKVKRARSFFEFENHESINEESDATRSALMSVNHLLGEAETPVAHNRRYLDADDDDTDDEEEEGCENENNDLSHFDSSESFYYIDEDQENIPPSLDIYRSSPSHSFLPVDQSQSNYNGPFQFADPNILENHFENNQMEQPAEVVEIPNTLNRQPRCRVSSGTATLMLLGLQRNMEDLDYLRGSN